ncbi:MAG: nucleotidyltransferase domain-containing protein [Thermoanaerobaculia bacterium]
MIDEVIVEEVRRRLDQVETSEGVRILLAVESGSRAWGFPSKDSDYDVRFVYIHPPEWYLSVDAELRRDVIERPILDEIDLSGWEIRKALLLFAKSNPPLLEWLASPLIYSDTQTFAPRLRDLLPTYYAPNASLYHYLHMAQGNFKDYLRGDVVWVKKYFYVLRPLLAVRWIEQARGPVPMLFTDVLVTIADKPELVAEIETLRKREDGRRGARPRPGDPGHHRLRRVGACATRATSPGEESPVSGFRTAQHALPHGSIRDV